MTTRARCVIAVLGLAAAGLLPVLVAAQAPSAPAANTLTAAERAAGWRLLFDGRSLDGWRGYKSDAAPPGWRVVDGTLTKDGQVADIVSREQFGDFELEMEWKIGDAGNSGIFYRGTEEDEPHLLDGAGIPAARRRPRRGQQDAARPVPARPMRSTRRRPGTSSRSASGTARASSPAAPHVEHWLNGIEAARVRAVEPRLGSEGRGQQVRQVAALRPGHHADTSRCRAITPALLAFRNIRIRELPAS